MIRYSQVVDAATFKTLQEIKKRLGRREFPLAHVQTLIKLGLAAGDYSLLYVTDKLSLIHI